jgi:hypothetical protein
MLDFCAFGLYPIWLCTVRRSLRVGLQRLQVRGGGGQLVQDDSKTKARSPGEGVCCFGVCSCRSARMLLCFNTNLAALTHLGAVFLWNTMAQSIVLHQRHTLCANDSRVMGAIFYKARASACPCIHAQLRSSMRHSACLRFFLRARIWPINVAGRNSRWAA